MDRPARRAGLTRAGGLVATALLGAVLAARVDRLLAAFHVTMIIGAVICAAASLSAFALIER